MIILPINTDDQTLIVVVIEKENLERMKQADPITLHSIEQGGTIDILHPNNYEIVLAYEEDSTILMAMAQRGDVRGMLRYLSRGFNHIEGVDGVKTEHIGQEHCSWTCTGQFNIWKSSCDHELELHGGDPTANGMEYCTFCGKPLKQEN